MKIFSLTVLLSLTTVTFIGCGGGAGTNTNVNTNARAMNAANSASMGSNSSAANSNVPSNTGNSNMSMSNSGAGGSATEMNSFMMEAARSGMAEVELGRLAQTKAQNADVKKFAQQMVQDHTNSNTELKSLAGRKNVSLPTEMDAAHQAIKEKLSGLSGAEFDKEYMKGQVDDHEKAVSLFQSQADGGTDADTKALAAKTLPNLKMHLEHAREIHGKLK